ncbi:MAG: hypothetical protein E5Y06_09995 [Mesorhizobium sp.]|nr:MAG: hypothetical protein E5Y06_09995 [Mesorhizobium sp.]TJU99621.1 MAG: hypothetical protein E5Y08_08090 [Mesorhizobium sp.]TJV18325.1 MAG: hypothetical protein E5Y07_08620 [Mesorhizobium sp.]
MVMLGGRLWAWQSAYALSRAAPDRPPLRRALLDTSPSIDGGEEGCEPSTAGSLPLPPEGGEVALRSSDGVGEPLGNHREPTQHGNQAQGIVSHGPMKREETPPSPQ